MAGKKLEYEVKVDASDATSELKKVGEAGEKAGKQLTDGFKDAGSKSEAAFDKVISGMKEITDESKRTIAAVGKIGEAFGEGFNPESGAQLVGALRKAGAEFDTIEGKADQLASTLREVDGVKLEGANVGLKNVRTGLDETTDAARGANSALANMVGNTAQDLGELGGVAGSSGVLIGQMAEYMSDAKLSGQAFGSVMKDFAKIVGPVAALAAATKLVGSVMDNLGAEAERSAGNVDALKEAMDGAEVSATDLLSTIQIRPEMLTIPESVTVSWEDFGDSISAVVNGVLPFLGSELDTVDVAAIFDKANISLTAFSRGVTGTVDELGTLEAALLEAKDAGLISNDEWLDGLHAIDLAIGEVSDAEAEAAKERKMFAVDGAAAQELMAEAIKSSIDPLEQYTNQWAALIDALRSNDERLTPGQLADESQEAADAINFLSEALDMSPTDVVALAWERLNEGIDANAELTDESAKAMQEAADKARDMALAVGDLTESIADINADDLDNIASGFQAALDSMDDGIGHLAFAENFQHEFDDALKEADKFGPDMKELLELQAQGVTITPDIVLGEVEEDDADFLAWVQSLQQMVKGGAVEAFKTGGVDAATAFVQSSAATFLAAHPEATLADFYRLMGLPEDGNVAAFIQIQLDAEAKADALATLDALAGVDPNNPIIANLKLALQTGAIDPVTAEIASLLLAQQYGVDVTPQLAAFTPEQIAAAQGQIDAGGGVTVPVEPEVSDSLWGNLFPATQPPVSVPVELKAPDLGAVGTLIDAVATKKRTANLKVTADNAGAVDKILDTVASQARTADINVKADNAGAIDKILDTVASPRTASITAEAHPAGANSALNGVALPRTATINVSLPNAVAADRTLDQVAAPRFADVYVRTHNTVTTSVVTTGGGGKTAGGLSAGPLAAEATATDEVGINPLADPAVVVTPSFGTPVSLAGPTFTPTVHNHVTIQAAVIGSRFDVQRAVTKALRQAHRLNGGRAA